MGNAAAWLDFEKDVKRSTIDEAAGNLVYAAFDPDVTGEIFLPLFLLSAAMYRHEREQLRIVLTTSVAHNGAHIEECHVADPWIGAVKPWATSPIEAERLWKLSEKLVGQEFGF